MALGTAQHVMSLHKLELNGKKTGQSHLRQVIVQRSDGLLKLPVNIAQAVPMYFGVFCDLCDLRGVSDLFPCILGAGRNPAIGQAEDAFGGGYRRNFARKSVRRSGKCFGPSRPGLACPGRSNLACRSFEQKTISAFFFVLIYVRYEPYYERILSPVPLWRRSLHFACSAVAS
jgi:hypothetical protein